MDTAFDDLPASAPTVGITAAIPIIDETVPYMNEDGMVTFKSIDEAIRHYVDERDSLGDFMKAANAHEAAVKGRLEKISMWLRDKGDELGTDSFKTQSGTAYRNVKVSYRMGDWNEFIAWIKRTDNFQCLEKRVAKNATKEVHDDTGEIPPGVEYVAEVEFNVRRPTNAKE